MSSTTLLGIIMSLILFFNKLCLLEDKTLGWKIGAFGTILAIVYLWLINFYIMSISEIGILVIMLYGAFAKEFSLKSSKKIEWWVNGITVCTVIFLTYFTFSGLLKIAECGGSLFALFGLYALTHKHKPLGWFFLFICHLCTTYMAYYGTNPQPFFGDFQIASAIVAVYALVRKYI